jgi:hypothetical protein
MGTFVTFTTIRQPTASLEKWASVAGCSLVGSGDRKTPENWHLPGCDFVSAAAQARDFEVFSAALPWNSYSRKMIAYLRAIRSGADVIVDTDDDNAPLAIWKPDFNFSATNVVRSTFGFFNVYSYFSSVFPFWPRGYPLDDVQRRARCTEFLADHARVGAWQGMVEGDPDVDAIYRMTVPRMVETYFQSNAPIALDYGLVCPFNSQNTAFRRELFPLLYLPVTATIRFCDILRGMVAQPIMWKHGYRLGFTEATVVQERNEHKLLDDFVSEIPVYCCAHKIPGLVKDAIASVASSTCDIFSDLTLAYQCLAKNGIVDDKELIALEAWLTEISTG